MPRSHRVCIAPFVLALLWPLPAHALGDSSIVFHLRADVALSCRISAADEGRPVKLVGDRADLGMVRESCNSADGYVVRASFENIRAGALNAGAETARIDAAGDALLVWPEARDEERVWFLSDVLVAAADRPIYLRLTISPL